MQETQYKSDIISGMFDSIIPNGLEVVAIDGTKEIWNGKQDSDYRFGCLAYGLVLEK